jgi:hypothetical protein
VLDEHAGVARLPLFPVSSLHAGRPRRSGWSACSCRSLRDTALDGFEIPVGLFRHSKSLYCDWDWEIFIGNYN